MLQQLQKKYLGETIPLINIHGVINSQAAEKVSKALSKINTSRAVALAVSVNSPGGTPVQSLIIANKIQHFAQKHNLRVFTFASNLAASGGYFVLCAGNHVCADRTSIVGSIGVVFPKWNLQGLLDATSLENKSLYTSKDSLYEIFDPFKASTEQQKQQVREICDHTHEKFIKHVQQHRGKKLMADDKLFTGQVFNGEEAKEKGLVDEVGSMVQILQKYYPGSKLDIQREKESVWQRIFDA